MARTEAEGAAMADRNTLEQDIDEVLGALAAAEASPGEIDWEPTPEPV